MERDQRAYDLHRRGLSYRQIAAEMEWRSPNAAVEAVRRAARDNATNPFEQAEARQAALDRLQDYRRAAYRVLAARHYHVAQSGKLVDGPDGGFLLDDEPALKALDRLCKIDDMDNRLRGLYPPVKHEVRQIDAIDARLLDLADQVALGDPAAAPGVPREA
jgi:hypothetical protein